MASEKETAESGGVPNTIGKCTECGSVYVVREVDGSVHPVGTSGLCECGNDEFDPA